MRRDPGIAVVLLSALGLGIAHPAHSQTEPLVWLDAQDVTAARSWPNRGTLGPFASVGTPSVRTVDGVPAVFLNAGDAYRGPVSVPSIEGRAPRSIEVWVYRPAVREAEETIVAWGRRGGPAGGEIALNYGRSPNFGAVTHWAADMGWGQPPAAGHWHYLVYTYDGTQARIYEDTALESVLKVALDTIPGQTINLGAQNGADGKIQFRNEYNGSPMSGPLAIAEVRITAHALPDTEIHRRFQAEAARFHASARRSLYDLLLGRGIEHMKVGALTLGISPTTQQALSLTVAGGFDFLPYDRLIQRAHDGFYQLGDVDFRTRIGAGPWQSYSTAAHHEPLQDLHLPGALAAADLSPELPAASPLRIVREWRRAPDGMVMRFVVTNRSAHKVTLGAFGAAMVCNNVLTDRSLEEAHEECCFADPYIGGDAGYLQMTRLNGQGPVLLVIPEKGTGFEAYRPLHDDPTPRSVTFEGFYEWTVHSAAYAAQEWKSASGWNLPTEQTLRPGQSVSYGFRFFLAPAVRAIESTLAAHARPVAIGVPGYVLPTDEAAKLFIHAASPVRRMTFEPTNAARVSGLRYRLRQGWSSFQLRGLKPGRCRLNVLYNDGSRQYIHYFVTLPASELVRRLGEFHARRQWFDDPADPFHRTDSFLPYQHDWGRKVIQYDPTWMVGQSDEMGAGPNLLMAVKNLGQPDPAQVKLLERYVNHALWGHLQYPDYGVRASLFYYDPGQLPGYYTVRGGWDRARTETTWRSFNYPHQAAIYWSLYRLARNHPGLVTTHSWRWCLRQAYRTAMAMGSHAGPPPGGLQQFGQMVGDVYIQILQDLKREGWHTEATDLERYERLRADHFRSLRYPFGSEMPWDSTGQEEVYLLCRYFGFDDKAKVTVDAVLGYDPTLPNWGYNGAARRYFDEAVNGTQWPDIMRLLHHYGGAMNAIPLLAHYRDHPEDLYLLRVGYAGMQGALTDIAPDGFGSQCFDPDPAIMKFDPFVGDYGIEFYGFSTDTGSYVVHDPLFGWLGFGCDVEAAGSVVRITPRDAFRNRLYLAPLGLYLTLDAGTFQSAAIDSTRRRVSLTLGPASRFTPRALLRIERSSSVHDGRRFVPSSDHGMARGAFAIRLNRDRTQVQLISSARPRSSGP